jgi:hypothetical protein
MTPSAISIANCASIITTGNRKKLWPASAIVYPRTPLAAAVHDKHMFSRRENSGVAAVSIAVNVIRYGQLPLGQKVLVSA